MRRNTSKPQYPELRSRKWMYERYVTRGMGPTAIARELGCSVATASNAITAHQLPLKRPRDHMRLWSPDRQELLEAYHAAGSLAELARRQDLSLASVRNVFRRLGLDPHKYEPRRGPRSKYPLLASKDWLARAVQEKTLTRIAEEVGCSVNSVRTACREHGLEHTFRAGDQVREDVLRLWREGEHTASIARLLDRHVSQVMRILTDAGIGADQRHVRREAVMAARRAQQKREREAARQRRREVQSKAAAEARVQARVQARQGAERRAYELGEEARRQRLLEAAQGATQLDILQELSQMHPPTRRRLERNGPFRIQPDEAPPNSCPGCGLECGPFVCCLSCWGLPPSRLSVPDLQAQPVGWVTRLRAGVTDEEFDAITAALQEWLRDHAARMRSA